MYSIGILWGIGFWFTYGCIRGFGDKGETVWDEILLFAATICLWPFMLGAYWGEKK